MDFQTFVEAEFKPRLSKLQADTPRVWGSLSAQGMVEHLALPLMLGMGAFPGLRPLYEPERLAANYQRTFVEKTPIPRNFKAGLVAAEPPPLEYESLEEAKDFVLDLVQQFADFWTQNPGAKVLHPVFGELGQADWDYFQQLHLGHHLAQFGL